MTLSEIQAWRNCGALYQAFVEQDEFTIYWCQVDTGMSALCYCQFDLSVTYGPLEPGDYVAKVFYTDAAYPEDTIYEGSMEFSIEVASRGKSIIGGIISSFQSDCYTLQGVEEQDPIPSLIVYPVPVHNGDLIHIESQEKLENARLEIYSISGQRIFYKEYMDTGELNET